MRKPEDKPRARPPRRGRQRGIALLAALSVAALLATDILADVVEFKSGWKAEGVVTETATHVTVTLRSGLRIRYKREDVARIVRKQTPAQTFKDKYAAVKRGDAAALKELATWCRLKGLGPQAARVAADILAIRPDSAFAKNLLIRHKMVRESIPRNREKDLSLAKQFGPRFRIYQTRHFRVCYNTDEEYAKDRGKILEALYEQFYRHFDDMGMSMKFLKDRLEVVLFRSRQEYVRFATSAHPALANSAGFYSRDDDRAYFFDATGGGQYTEARKRYAAAMRELRDMRDQVRSYRPGSRFTFSNGGGGTQVMTRSQLRKRIADIRKDMREQWRKFCGQRQNLNLAVTQHECAHQLSFVLGVLPLEPSRTPRWLAEGIATFFERSPVSRTAKATGENAGRLQSYRRNQAGLFPIQRLLTDDRVFLSPQPLEMEVSYAQCWSLFCFLSARRPAQLVSYLRGLLAKGAPRPTHATRLAEFRKAFGPFDRFEREWRAYVTALKE